MEHETPGTCGTGQSKRSRRTDLSTPPFQAPGVTPVTDHRMPGTRAAVYGAQADAEHQVNRTQGLASVEIAELDVPSLNALHDHVRLQQRVYEFVPEEARDTALVKHRAPLVLGELL